MCVVSFKFDKTDLLAVTINGKSWVRAKYVRDTLKYNKKTAEVIKAHVSPRNYTHQHDLKGFTYTG